MTQPESPREVTKTELDEEIFRNEGVWLFEKTTAEHVRDLKEVDLERQWLRVMHYVPVDEGDTTKVVYRATFQAFFDPEDDPSFLPYLAGAWTSGVRVAAKDDDTWAVLNTLADEVVAHGVELDGVQHYPTAETRDLIRVYRLEELDFEEAASSPRGQRRPRKSNRKIVPAPTSGTVKIANIPHGTRPLGNVISGSATWIESPEGRSEKLALLDGEQVALIDYHPREAADITRIIESLSPRALKTMAAVSSLLYDKTRGRPVNHAATLTIGEIARRMGYKVSTSRHIDPEIQMRVAADIRNLTRIKTYAATGEYDTRAKRYPRGWISPLLLITAVKVEQGGLDSDALPFEFDAMLGKNWAEAIGVGSNKYDILQISEGFTQLDPAHEAQALLLWWHYTNEFRRKMVQQTLIVDQGIDEICRKARIDKGQKKHAGRFLARLHSWHERLAEVGVIGEFRRTPDVLRNEHGDPVRDERGLIVGSKDRIPPLKTLEEGRYIVCPPGAIVEAYATARLEAEKKRKQGRPNPGKGTSSPGHLGTTA